jgi:cell division septation protein DedD
LTFSEVASNSSTCQTAIAVPGPYTTPITIYGNTQNSIGYNQGSCGLSTSSLIDWYILTPQAGSQVEVTTCNSVTNFDTRLAILTGSCSALSCLVSNDDNCTTNSYASYVTFVAGTSVSSYYLAVFGYGTASGAYEVRIVEHPVQSTPGGDCPSAIPLPFTSGGYQYYLGNTENNPLATTYACTSINSRSSWYRLDVPSGYYGEITVSTCNQGTNYDTLLAIYSGSCSQLLCVTYNDDNSCSLSSLASTAYWYASSSFDAEEKNVATISPTSTSSLSKSASASQSASSSPSSTYSATSSSTRSFVQPSPSPSRSNSANLGTVTYYIQVAGYSSSSVGTYGLSVQIQ